ncbi:MAG: hypothetical protein WCY88_01845 [Spongiibacteraceae bacterium]
MQISGLPIVSSITPPSVQTQRTDITERVQKDVQRETTRSNDERSNSSLDELKARSQEILQQRLESSARANAVNSKQRAEDDNLSRNTRRALDAFAQNTPSLEQQLGIELVGVDTYA